MRPTLPFLLLASSVVAASILAGCSTGPAEVVGPSGSRTSNSVDRAPSLEIAAQPGPFDHWSAPKLRISGDGWKGGVREGISLSDDVILERDVASGAAVGFEWSGRPKSGNDKTMAYRWTLDIEDIVDETPRLNDDDLAHWSPWSRDEKSATVGPFDGSPDSPVVHFFHVETRDEKGFVSLATVRMTVTP